MSLKHCSNCNSSKDRSEFSKNKNTKDGLNAFCKVCSRILSKEYIKNNKEKRKMYFKKKHQEDPFYFIKQNRKYSKKHVYKDTPDRIFYAIVGNAKKRNIDVLFVKEEFINWYQEQSQECFYCKRLKEECLKDYPGEIKRLSIDRLNSALGYSLDNIVLACFTCNDVKSDYWTAKEMLETIGPLIRLKERKNNASNYCNK